MTNMPFIEATDQDDMARMTMGDIFNKNMDSLITDRTESLSGSNFLNRTRLTLQGRVTMKKNNSIRPSLTMKVQDLVSDLLKNGLDLSFLDDTRRSG